MKLKLKVKKLQLRMRVDKAREGNRLIDLHTAIKENPLSPARKPERKRNTTTNLINSQNVKKRMLEYSKSNRAGKYTRVSKETLMAANRAIDAFCLKVVTDARGGKTL